jgi:hypothetical protein
MKRKGKIKWKKKKEEMIEQNLRLRNKKLPVAYLKWVIIYMYFTHMLVLVTYFFLLLLFLSVN